MMGIIRNRSYYWIEALLDIPKFALEVFSLGFLATSDFKIYRSYNPWIVSVICLVTSFIIVLSLGHLSTDWNGTYWSKRC